MAIRCDACHDGVKRSCDKWTESEDVCTCDVCNAEFPKDALGFVCAIECCDEELMLRYGCVDCRKKLTVLDIKDMTIGKSPCGRVIHNLFGKVTL